MHPLPIAAAFSLSLSGLSAQAVWVVDLLLRPGAHSANLAATIAVTSPGDIVIVRNPGDPTLSYAGAAINHSLTILGEGSARPIILGTLRIQNLAATDSVLVSGLALSAPYGGSPDALVAQANLGRILLSSCEVHNGVFAQQRVAFTDCRHVALVGCTLNTSHNGTIATRSSLHIEASVLESPPITWPSGGWSAPGLRLVDAEATAVRTTLRGSGGYHINCAFSCNTTGMPAHPAVYVDATSRFAAGAGSSLEGSISTITYSVPYSYSESRNEAVTGTGIAVCDPSCRVLGTSIHSVASLPQTYAGVARAGGIVRVGVAAPSGSIAMLAVSYRPNAPTPTGLGPVWLDLPNMFVLGIGTTDTLNGRFERVLPMTASVPLGAHLVGQSALVTPTGALQLASPAFFGVALP